MAVMTPAAKSGFPTTPGLAQARRRGDSAGAHRDRRGAGAAAWSGPRAPGAGARDSIERSAGAGPPGEGGEAALQPLPDLRRTAAPAPRIGPQSPRAGAAPARFAPSAGACWTGSRPGVGRARAAERRSAPQPLQPAQHRILVAMRRDHATVASRSSRTRTTISAAPVGVGARRWRRGRSAFSRSRDDGGDDGDGAPGHRMHQISS